MSKKAREIEISDDYLNKFPLPLWYKLDLESCKPLSAIEGEQDGVQFAIIDLQHRAYGLFADNGATDVTTFFITAIPEGIAGRQVSWRPVDCDVSVDKEYVYLAKPGKPVRPKEWRHLIQLTIDVGNSLESPSQTAGVLHAPERTYRPVGGGVFINGFWGVVCLVVSVLLVGTGLGIMFGFIDYRPDCAPGSPASVCKVTMTVYRFTEAIKIGLQYVFGGAFMFLGVLYFRERVRKRL